MRLIRFIPLLWLAPTLCSAEFRHDEDAGIAVLRVAPIAQLLAGLDRTVEMTYGTEQMDQQWDSARNHYVGSLLRYFHYPEIAHAGYHSFTVEPAKRYGHISSGSDEELAATVARDEQQAASGQDPQKISYHYDGAGWLKAIITERLTPESEGFFERRDSFDYTFFPDGTTDMRWNSYEAEHASYAVTPADCGPLPLFHHTYRYKQTRLRLDAFGNVVLVDKQSSMKLDTCKTVAGISFHMQMEYDEEGRLVRMWNPSSVYQGIRTETTWEYRPMPYQQFARMQKRYPVDIVLEDPAISSWLAEQRPRSYLEIHKMTYRYPEQESSRKNGHFSGSAALRDMVSRDSSYQLRNSSGQLLVFWEGNSSIYRRNQFTLLTHKREKGGPEQTLIQTIYLGVDTRRAYTQAQQETIHVTKAEIRQRDTRYLAGQAFHRYLIGRDVNDAWSTEEQIPFRSRLPDYANWHTTAIVQTDTTGLVQCVWTPEQIFKLSYGK